MFGSSKVSHVVDNAMNNDVKGATAVGVVVGLIIVLLLNFLLGPWLWNNVLRRLVPSLGTARWYDTVLLAVLVGLIVPH